MLLRNFWNTLKRYKVASILNILGLSIAFAAFAIIMMQVRYDLRYDRFHSKADRIFRYELEWPGNPGVFNRIASRPFLNTIAAEIPEVEAMTFFSVEENSFYATNEDRASYPFRESWVETTPDVYRVFDFNFIAGDPERFLREDQVLISASQAGKLFPGLDPVGRFLYPNDAERPLEVVAVYRDFPSNSTLRNIIYKVIDDKYLYDQGMNMFSGYLLLSSANSAEIASETMAEVLPAKYKWHFEEERQIRLVSLIDTHYVTDVEMDDVYKINKTTVYTLILIAILIILIAAINFVNFSTSLVPSRLKSVNTQKVLGASEGGIRRNMVFEAVGISVIAVCLSFWMIYMSSLSGLASLLQAEIAFRGNGIIIGGAILLALLTGLIAGVYPAWYITSFPPALVLKGSFGLSPGGRKLRTVLIGFQYVISLVLILVAFFIHGQNRFMRNLPLGFNKDHILVTDIDQEIFQLDGEISQRLKQNPDISEVAFSVGRIVDNMRMFGDPEYRGENIQISAFRVTPDFVRLMGMTITEGRDFRPDDKNLPQAAWIFNEMARNAYGMEPDTKINDDFWGGTIIGFTEDFNSRPLHYGISPVGMFVSGTEFFAPFDVVAYIKVNEQRLPESIAFIQKTLGEIRNIPPQEIQVSFLDESIDRFYRKETQLASLISAFSVLAILISIMGVFGLVLFETQYRRKEIGIRKINGATIPEVLALLNRGFVRIVAVCFLVALPLAIYTIGEWRSTFAYKAPVYWWIFAAGFLLVLGITLLTVTLQSYRAATENPVNSIKTD